MRRKATLYPVAGSLQSKNPDCCKKRKGRAGWGRIRFCTNSARSRIWVELRGTFSIALRFWLQSWSFLSMNQPPVFISCDSPEFRQTRSRVADILTRLGYTLHSGNLRTEPATSARSSATRSTTARVSSRSSARLRGRAADGGCRLWSGCLHSVRVPLCPREVEPESSSENRSIWTSKPEAC